MNINNPQTESSEQVSYQTDLSPHLKTNSDLLCQDTWIFSIQIVNQGKTGEKMQKKSLFPGLSGHLASNCTDG